ncbi:uncharacterized protein LOC129600329 [Paramacrobiotus metropolitanus]|uniref:uncharacterized protein LOC129600329 n=1 Tax=Paramacrobiotus metropolitanus TaxID=2943436 RepID=UPI0024462187|nr:uncharacterized protein LOC129600329 [Paramacrobiotus metropolitanus]
MSYILLLLGMLASRPGCVFNGCPFGGRNPVQRLRAELEASMAEIMMFDNVLNLSALEDPAQVQPVQPPPGTVRVPVGERATFQCDADTPASAQRIVWRHHNATIHGDDVPDSPKGHFYRQMPIRATSNLFIHNVGRDSGGTVECFDPCNGSLCRLREFYLQPELRARDVFVPPMRDVSTSRWSFSMACSGSVDCSQTPPVAHFIWKYEDYFVAAPYPDLLGFQVPGLLNASVTFNVSAPGAIDPVCSSTLAISMREEAEPRSAQVDCWFRTDVRRRDWFTQKAYVHFT